MTSATTKPRAGEHTREIPMELPEITKALNSWQEMRNYNAELLAEQTRLRAERDELAKALEVCDKAIRGVIGDGPVRGNGTPYPVWADMISAAVQARAILAKHGR